MRQPGRCFAAALVPGALACFAQAKNGNVCRHGPSGRMCAIRAALLRQPMRCVAFARLVFSGSW